MKNRTAILSIFSKSLLVLILSLNFTFKTFAKTSKKRETIVLSGKIKNIRKNNIRLTGFKFNKKIKLNRETGTFSVALEKDKLKKGHYFLRVRKRKIALYLDAKNSLFIEFDYKNKSIPLFKGDNQLVTINNYLQEKETVFLNIVSDAYSLFLLKENQFIQKMDTYTDSSLNLLHKSKLPNSYRIIEKNNINYLHYRNFQNYEPYYGLVNDNLDFKASPKIWDKLKKISLDKEKLYLFSENYRNFIFENLRYEILKHPKENKAYSLDIIKKKISNKFIKDELLFETAKNDIGYSGNISLYYEKYISYNSNRKYKNVIKKMYNDLKPIQKGKPSPKFKNFENYYGGKTSLDDLLNKGDYIYINIWATWCGFCKRETPVLKNFIEKYEDSNITFVGINVDNKEDRTKWKKNILANEIGGIQLFSGKEIKDLDFAKKYLVKDLPKFILLAPDGTIININAPRPSEGHKLDTLFQNLGIKPN